MKILSEQIKNKDGFQKFKMLHEYSQPNIPLCHEERTETDRWFFFVFVFCIIVLGLFPFIYVLSYADINRYNGYDECGNVCGQKNRENLQWDCTGQDNTLKPFYARFECLTEDQYNHYEYSLTPKKTISTNIRSFAAVVARAFFVPFGFCLILAVLFRYVTAITVWILLILCWVIFPVLPLYIWWVTDDLSIFWSIYASISLLMVCVSVAARRKIALVIAMLKEASKIVFATPRVIFNAIKASVISSLLIVLVWFAVLFLRTSGILTKVWYNERLDYIPTSSMIAGNCLCGVIALWMILYVIGAGFVDTSAVVANKYFSNKEDNNVGPTSQYHSGTIAMVSLLTGIMAIPRFILATLAQISVLKNLMDLCLRYVDGYCTKNVYVATAMYGTSFAESGKKAVKLSKESVGNSMSALNFADFLLISTQIIMIIAVLLTYVFLPFEIFYTVFDFVFVLAISFVSSELVLGHVKAAMSTIFFCVCQDNLLEKEANRSYTMSRDEYLTSSDKFFAFKFKEKWQPSNLSTA